MKTLEVKYVFNQGTLHGLCWLPTVVATSQNWCAACAACMFRTLEASVTGFVFMRYPLPTTVYDMDSVLLHSMSWTQLLCACESPQKYSNHWHVMSFIFHHVCFLHLIRLSCICPGSGALMVESLHMECQVSWICHHNQQNMLEEM